MKDKIETLELIKDAARFGGTVPKGRIQEVDDLFDKLKQLLSEPEASGMSAEEILHYIDSWFIEVRGNKKEVVVCYDDVCNALNHFASTVREKEEWVRKAPDSVGNWVRLNAIHRPEVEPVVEDYRNDDKALCISWGWGDEKGMMRIKDNLDKIEHFYWFKLPELPPRELPNPPKDK